MGTSNLMNIGQRAMFASYAALQTTSNNIANANTAGYSRQTVQVATAGGQFTGAGFFGQGVNVATVTRAYDGFLTTQATNSNAIASADAARLAQLKMLENVFPLGESGLGYAAGQLVNSFVDVANNPQDASARQVVLTRANDLAARFKSAADQLSELQVGVKQDVQSAVGAVNGLAKQVAKLNNEIAAARGTGHTPNDLLDQRDALVKEISGYIHVTSLNADDGSVSLFVAGGQSLVLGTQSNTLKAVADDFDPAKVQIAMVEGPTTRVLDPTSLGGGSMAGLMRFQNEDLANANALLGQMAVAISGALNQQQALGLDLGKPAQNGSPILSVGDPRALFDKGNTGNAALGITISDTAQVQASDYELQFDGTNYNLTRLSDSATAGGPYSAADLSAGVTVDGMTITLNTGAANTGDRFLLQPVSTAAQYMQTVLSNPNGIAAASPVTGNVAATNTGTGTIASLRAVDPSLDRTLTASIAFTSDTGDYDWQMLDAGGAVVSSGSATWTPGQPIALNGFELKLNGVPRDGDSFSVAPTVNTSGNNGNALGFVDLANKTIVGGATLADGTPVAGKTMTDAFASAISEIGVRVQSGTYAADVSGSVASNAENARANQSGVNLDEEAARLIQYQQSYQASAKVLQVAQTIFDTLLQMTSR
jgi:flagellar hook-associated protein 1 FlgK